MKKPSKSAQNLIEFLSDDQFLTYAGKSFAVRADVLVLLITGCGRVADVAARHRISRQAVNRHVRRARALFGFGNHRLRSLTPDKE